MRKIKKYEEFSAKAYNAIHDVVAGWVRKEVPSANERDSEEAGRNFMRLLEVVQQIQSRHAEELKEKFGEDTETSSDKLE